jgi:hypothetical protein
MRNDMKKVLTERPRAHSSWRYRDVRAKQNNAARDLDDLPHFQGMRRPYGWDTKEFSDLLGPLIRYLRSCIGRKWDDVWSEICQQLSNNTVDSHLKEHVMMEVETKTVLVDGEVLCHSRFGVLRSPHRLYVDPSSGRLAAAPPRHDSGGKREQVVVVDGLRYKKDEAGILHPSRQWWKQGWYTENYPRKIIGKEKEAFLVDGIWYWAVFATVPPRPVKQTPTGTILGYISRQDIVTGQMCTEGRYRADKRQLSSRDLRHHDLSNT